MTAEIAILNKSSVALAADSAVTVSSGSSRKTYEVNKLFTLSKTQPVGVMIFGNAALMGVPWETLIKEYRGALGSDYCDSVEDYADDFIEYVQSHKVFTKKTQERFLSRVCIFKFRSIKEKIDEEIKSKIDDSPTKTINKRDVTSITKRIFSECKRDFQQKDKLENANATSSFIKRTFKSRIQKCIDLCFTNLSKANQELLKDIAVLHIVREHHEISNSGIVIAGFGNAEIYPALVEIATNCAFGGKLVYKLKRKYEIDADNTSGIFPFAQGDVVATLLEGVDPFYKRTVESTLKSLFAKYPDKLFESLSSVVKLDDIPKPVISKIRQENVKIVEACLKRFAQLIQTKHITPLLAVVDVLPKENLASMAEALISLTSAKRQMSLEIETVGGPIDVAVISKGDGFVWLKRKHYFDASLNENWFRKYHDQ